MSVMWGFLFLSVAIAAGLGFRGLLLFLGSVGIWALSLIVMSIFVKRLVPPKIVLWSRGGKSK